MTKPGAGAEGPKAHVSEGDLRARLSLSPLASIFPDTQDSLLASPISDNRVFSLGVFEFPDLMTTPPVKSTPIGRTFIYDVEY